MCFHEKIQYSLPSFNFAKTYEEQYEVIKTFNENQLLKHVLVDELQVDYKDLLLAGLLLIEIYRKVEMLPVLHEKEDTYRKKLLLGVKHNKNPDFRIDGEYWELESPKFPYKYNNLEARIRSGAAQADKIILYFMKEISINRVEYVIKERLKFDANLKEIVIIVRNKIVKHIKIKSR